MNTVLLILSCLIVYCGALKCYQGSYNTTQPLSGVATECSDPYSITCIKQYDLVSKFATRMCSTTNCTLNGGYVRDPVCVNVSSYQTNCCCYTEGCNSAPSTVLTFSIAAVFAASISYFFINL